MWLRWELRSDDLTGAAPPRLPAKHIHSRAKCAQLSVRAYVYVYVYVCVFACVRVCVCVCVCVCTRL